MEAWTLYQELGSEVREPMGHDRGRTEQTAAKETIDNDWARSTLYAAIGEHSWGESDRGRTEVTKADAETVDRDRHVPSSFSALLGGDGDLYAVLGTSAASGGDHGRTEVTESTETIDWDRPPVGPGT